MVALGRKLAHAARSPAPYARQLRFLARNRLAPARETRLLHFSFHKCLTKLYSQVLKRTLEEIMLDRHRHFKSWREAFERDVTGVKSASLNNHALDLAALGVPYRASLFIRDPRDLVVSGYYYHLAGRERWSRERDPSPGDWALVRGNIPANMPAGYSFAEYLASLDLENGLLAEIEFRKFHFEAMRSWDLNQEHLHVFYYEDIVGNEESFFYSLAEAYDFPESWRRVLVAQARRHALDRATPLSQHIRNPQGGQWRDTFTPAVDDAFYRAYADIVAKFRYPAR